LVQFSFKSVDAIEVRPNISPVQFKKTTLSDSLWLFKVEHGTHGEAI